VLWSGKREPKAPVRFDPSPYHWVRYNRVGFFSFWYQNQRTPHEYHEDSADFPRDLKPGRRAAAVRQPGITVRFSGARALLALVGVPGT
jgi:hypothetical protein